MLLCFLIDKMGVSSERRSGAPSFQLFMFAVDNLTALRLSIGGSLAALGFLQNGGFRK